MANDPFNTLAYLGLNAYLVSRNPIGAIEGIGSSIARRWNEGGASQANLLGNLVGNLGLLALPGGPIRSLGRTETTVSLSDIYNSQATASILGESILEVNGSELRSRVLANIAESKAVNHTSNFKVLTAKENQFMSGYKSDTWVMIELHKGDTLYGGLPGQSAFYTTEEAILASQGNKNALYESLQVRLNPERGSYRPNIGEYIVTEDIRVPTGIVNANPSLGSGGARQFFIYNFGSKLQLRNELELGEFYGNRLSPY